MPTLPPATSTFVPIASPIPTTLPAPPNTSPVPAPTGADFDALTSGGTPSAAYFASLAGPAMSAYTTLSPSDEKGVSGNITSFLADGFVVAVETPLDPPTELANGALYAATATAVNATSVNVHVSGATVDQVPGGYAAMRVGDPVVAIGSGAAANFIADLVTGESASAIPTSSWARRPGTARRSVQAAGATARRAPRDDEGGDVTKFVITAKDAFPGVTFLPVGVPFATQGCVTISFQAIATAGFGESAFYPMTLADVSTSTGDPYVESQLQSLPVALQNDFTVKPGVHYRITSGLATSLSFLITETCGDFGEMKKGKPYRIQIGVVGQALLSTSTEQLPGVGANADFDTSVCPYIGFFGKGQPTKSVVLSNIANSLSVSFCENYTMTGAPLVAHASISNAQVVSAPISTGLPGSDWTWTSDLPLGDPGADVLPMAESNGEVQDNVLLLDSFQYSGIMNVVRELDVGFTGPLQFKFTDPPFVTPTVFQNYSFFPPYTNKVGISSPAVVSLTLHPLVPNVTARGK